MKNDDLISMFPLNLGFKEAHSNYSFQIFWTLDSMCISSNIIFREWEFTCGDIQFKSKNLKQFYSDVVSVMRKIKVNNLLNDPEIQK